MERSTGRFTLAQAEGTNVYSGSGSVTMTYRLTNKRKRHSETFNVTVSQGVVNGNWVSFFFARSDGRKWRVTGVISADGNVFTGGGTSTGGNAGVFPERGFHRQR